MAAKFISKCYFMVAIVAFGICNIGASESNYDMVMAGDQEPDESMKYQNFDSFYNTESDNSNSMAELDMQESRTRAYIRPPQPISASEKRGQESDKSGLDVEKERLKQSSLQKGNSRPKRNGLDWEQFDYDSYIN